MLSNGHMITRRRGGRCLLVVFHTSFFMFLVMNLWFCRDVWELLNDQIEFFFS